MMHGEKGYMLVARDVSPQYNKGMMVIPQLLGNNPEYFISLAQFLDGWGYDKLNWNLGCPVKNVTFKKKGSGLLPYPELVRDILEKTIPHITQKLSVKLRLGLLNKNEIFELIPVLNDFPLDYVIIHPRIATQMYEGMIHHDIFDDCLKFVKHEIVYNGDINSLSEFLTIQKKYPSVCKWMIGRGVLFNPLLPSIIKGLKEQPERGNKDLFFDFLMALYTELSIYRLNFQVINKIKDYWRYFSPWFVASQLIYEKITHAKSMHEIKSLTHDFFEKETFIY